MRGMKYSANAGDVDRREMQRTSEWFNDLISAKDKNADTDALSDAPPQKVRERTPLITRFHQAMKASP